MIPGLLSPQFASCKQRQTKDNDDVKYQITGAFLDDGIVCSEMLEGKYQKRQQIPNTWPHPKCLICLGSGILRDFLIEFTDLLIMTFNSYCSVLSSQGAPGSTWGHEEKEGWGVIWCFLKHQTNTGYWCRLWYRDIHTITYIYTYVPIYMYTISKSRKHTTCCWILSVIGVESRTLQYYS